MSTMPDQSLKKQTWTPTTYTVEHEFKYDLKTGELHHLLKEHVHHVVKLRSQLEDEIVLRAVVAELKMRGYTVVAPVAPGEPAPTMLEQLDEIVDNEDLQEAVVHLQERERSWENYLASPGS